MLRGLFEENCVDKYLCPIGFTIDQQGFVEMSDLEGVSPELIAELNRNKLIRDEGLEELTTQNAEEKLKSLNGVLVAPGFGERGIEGKIEAIKYI